MSTLENLGWSAFFADQAAAQAPELVPARVAVDHGRALVVHTGTDTCRIPPTAEGDVAVGDWVLLDPDRPRIVHRLERRTRLARKGAGRRSDVQVVAANLDKAFVVTSMNRDFKPRRVERYVAAIASGGADAVVVLNKADLDLGGHRRYLAQLPPHLPVLVTSALLDMGLDDLRERAGPGQTVGFVGMSGVGKSSLINALLGREVQTILEVRGSDDRGQHATTHRELIPLPEGGVLIDTPGMRELGLADGDGLSAAFPEIDALAGSCRFRDCGHGNEPGCAVQQAIADGDLPAARLDHWRKLAREAHWQEHRHDWQQRRERRRFAKMVRQVTSEKQKRR